MQEVQFLEYEKRLAEERTSKYRGTASIRLETLHFPSKDVRELDEKNVDRLIELFQKEGGCRRLEPQNHIPALVNPQQLEAALQASGVSTERLLADSYPELNFPPNYQLWCLHGRHRIQAAARVLPLNDRRWVVDLYHKDVTDELKTTLIEEYSNERDPDDGEIYRKIREYQGYRGVGNPYFERKWWARLQAISNHKKENLEQLFRHPQFKAAFDIQLLIPGLGDGMRLSTIHKMFAMKCDKEILHYLNYIKEVWCRILRHNKHAMQRIDRATVKGLELTAPGACRSDAEIAYNKLQSSRIFSQFTNEDRQAVWSEVLSVSRVTMIPSLFSFFEDVNYLKGPADCVRSLIQVAPRDDISTALNEIFSDVNRINNRFDIQESEATYISRSGSPLERAELGYRQIWIYSMRNYMNMSTSTTRKNILAKAACGKPNQSTLWEFATLARKLGFESEQINSLISRSPDREIARNALIEARNPGRYRYDTTLEEYIDQIVNIFQLITQEEGRPICQLNYSNRLPKRCGIPNKHDYQQDRLSLFLSQLHNNNEEQLDTLTSFFIRRSVYLAFFGRLTWTDVDSSTNNSEDSMNIETVESEEQDQVQKEQEYNNQETFAQEQKVQQERLEQEQQKSKNQENLAKQRELKTEIPEKPIGVKKVKQKQRVKTIKQEAETIKQEQQAKTIKREEVERAETIKQEEQTKPMKQEEQESQYSREEQKRPPISTQLLPEQETIIEYYTLQLGSWQPYQRHLVDLTDLSNVGQLAIQYMEKGFHLHDDKMQSLTVKTCEDYIKPNKRNIILLATPSEISTDEVLEAMDCIE